MSFFRDGDTFRCCIGDVDLLIKDDKLQLMRRQHVDAVLTLNVKLEDLLLQPVEWNLVDGVLRARTELSHLEIELVAGDCLTYTLHGLTRTFDKLCIFPRSRFVTERWWSFVPDDNLGQKFYQFSSSVTTTAAAAAVQIAQTGGSGDFTAAPVQMWYFAPPPRVIAIEMPGHFQESKTWLGITIDEPQPASEVSFRVDETGFMDIEVVGYHGETQPGHSLSVRLLFGLKSPEESLSKRAGLAHGGVKPYAQWWNRPIFCTWGEQVIQESAWDSEQTGLDLDRVREWVCLLQSKTGVKDFTVLLDAFWFDHLGDYRAHPKRFGGTAGLRSLIDELHRKGHRVLLWLSPFSVSPDASAYDALSDGIVRDHAGNPVVLRKETGEYLFDYTRDSVREHMLRVVEYCLSPNGLDADGFKLDFNYICPHSNYHRLANPGWGVGDQYWARVLEFLHQHAHSVKPDAFITASSCEMYLRNSVDAIRLNDNFTDECSVWYRRAELVSRTMPGVFIDTDGWPMSRQKSEEYWMVAPVFGIPALYHVTAFDGREWMRSGDYRRLAGAWNVYLNAPVEPSMRLDIRPREHVFARYYTQGELAGELAAFAPNYRTLITYSVSRIMVTATRTGLVSVPIPSGRRVTAIDAIPDLGIRKPVTYHNYGSHVVFGVTDSADGDLWYEISLQNVN